jgi:alkenylglycerophosphocholine hydrolase
MMGELITNAVKWHSMSISLLGVAFGLAVIDWLAVVKSWRWLEYSAKPAVMVALLAWLGFYAGFQGPLAWFAAGIFLSLLGDVFLMPRIDRFIPGLISFLLAHLAYIAGLNISGPPPMGLPAFIFAGLILVYGFFFYRRLARALKKRNVKRLQMPLLVYALMIGTMLLSALLAPFRPQWEFSPALLAACGALLFFISDSVLAWNKFVKHLPAGRLLVMVTYHLGQFALIGGAALNFRSW